MANNILATGLFILLAPLVLPVIVVGAILEFIGDKMADIAPRPGQSLLLFVATARYYRHDKPSPTLPPTPAPRAFRLLP